jgi:SAM-dependent methyltransferase
MSELTSDFWEEKYLQGYTGWDIGQVSDPLRAIIDEESNKGLRILIPGAGNAWEAEYAWKSGFTNVFVLDFAPSALEAFKKRIPDFPASHLLPGDFFKHVGAYDLILEQTFFCALHPSLREDYAQHMFQLLKPGGRLRGVLFDAPKNSDSPPFGGSAREYRTLFSKHFPHVKIEPCMRSIAPRAGQEVELLLQK